MLKKIHDVIPLLIIEPVFILLNCPLETKEKMKHENLLFLQFDDVKSMA